MTGSHSLDLRQRVARFVEAGHSCHEAARHFEVSVAFVVRLMAAYRATGGTVNLRLLLALLGVSARSGSRVFNGLGQAGKSPNPPKTTFTWLS